MACADPFGELCRQVEERPIPAARRESYAELCVGALVTRRVPAARRAVAASVLGLLGRDIAAGTLTTSDLKAALPAADAYMLLRRVPEHADVSQTKARWLLGSEARLREFIDVSGAEDDWDGQIRVLDALLELEDDYGDGETFRPLILAFAVVWDQPRPPLHRQMGAEAPAPDPDLQARYRYYRRLFSGSRAEFRLRRLSVAALTFVIDVPVPVSELQWVLANERSRNWPRLFRDIEYRHDRIAAGQYQWPHGRYTLAAIREQGGICVDQAFYATICARARGVPAILFAGEGRRGPHAWFAYLRDENRWELDVGRYDQGKYATGFALDPQSNRPMTDHDVTYACDRALRSSSFTTARRHARLGILLAEHGARAAAIAAAETSIRLADTYDLPWRLLREIHTRAGDQAALLALYERKARAFRDYDDFVAEIRTEHARLLRSSGRVDEAERLLSRDRRGLDRDRDDLARVMLEEQLQTALQAGDVRDGRREFERVLREQRGQGRKLAPFLDAYLRFCERTDQAEAGARFAARYADSLRRSYRDDPEVVAALYRFEIAGWRLAGDERRAERVEREWARAKHTTR